MKQEIELKEGMTCVVKGGKLVVETPEWKPKAGDVVTTISPRGKTIFIYKYGPVLNGHTCGFYAGIMPNWVFDTDALITIMDDTKEVRPATSEERCTFFARLVAEGYKWNAKKLRLTKAEKWSPADGDFVVAGGGTITILGQKDHSGDFDVKCRLFKSGVLDAKAHGTYTSCFIENKATESERQRLLDALAKAGKRWNAELKRVEDVKPEYKEGDFLRTKGENVFIYKNTHHGRVFYHAFMFSDGGVTISDGPSCEVGSISRHAAEQEKQKLLDGLAKIGKKWNATKKRIEDIEPTVVEMTMEQVCEKLGMNVKIIKK